MSAGGDQCTAAVMGACRILVCADPNTGTPPPLPTAGNITITGARIPAGMPVVVMPGADGFYMSATRASRLWNAGDMLRMQAAGAATGVPTFDRMVTATGLVTVTRPTIDPATAVRINRASDLTVAWTPASSTLINVELSSLESTTVADTTTTVTCRFPGAAGMATVPSAVLMRIPTGGLGKISVGTVGVTSVSAGNYDVDLVAIQMGISAMGPATGDAQFN
jgi:hypothetical protein